MNQTGDILSIQTICNICQTSYGFTSADRRSIIVMVVLTGIALLLCYISVLWYAIRTRFIPDDKTLIIMENVHTNEVYNNIDEHDENIEENIQNKINTTTTTTQPAVLVVENEKERY